jgi:hypothetical protein
MGSGYKFLSIRGRHCRIYGRWKGFGRPVVSPTFQNDANVAYLMGGTLGVVMNACGQRFAEVVSNSRS